MKKSAKRSARKPQLTSVQKLVQAPASRKRSRAPLSSSRTSLKFLILFAISFLLFGGGIALALDLQSGNSVNSQIEGIHFPAAIAADYRDLSKQLASFNDLQSTTGVTIADDMDIQSDLSQIQLDVAAGKYILAKQDLKILREKLADWNEQLSAYHRASPTPITTPVTKAINYIKPTPSIARDSKFLPIILYHLTPANFDAQLTHLEQVGYTTVNFAQVTASLNGGTALPSKPVVITFDDGFSDQLKAFEILKRHNMKATFYIINGGEASRWCIGAGRRYGDPLQPPSGCGDSYMNWDQVRMLDASGLMTIGAHTIDHQNLAGDTAEQQRFEIVTSKTGIEQELGHQIFDFCYPYGSYNQTSINIVREAGFTTATTTLPGTYQPVGDLFILRRIRDSLTLQ